MTQGTNFCNPRTKYTRSKNVFDVTSIALSLGHVGSRLLQPLAQSLIGSPGTLALVSILRKMKPKKYNDGNKTNLSCKLVHGSIGPWHGSGLIAKNLRNLRVSHRLMPRSRENEISDITPGQKCVIQMEMSDSRISCTWNGTWRGEVLKRYCG